VFKYYLHSVHPPLRKLMDAIDFFAKNALTIIQITHIQNPTTQDNKVPPYAFAYPVTSPNYILTKGHHYRTTSLPRYYLNMKSMTTPWNARKIGPLWTPNNFVCCEPIRIHDRILVDANHSNKGYFALSHLPKSWSLPIIEFFKLCQNVVKTRYMLSTKDTRTSLEHKLYIKTGTICITTLYHALVCFLNKDFSIIVDMLRYPRRRQHPEYVTFEEMKQSIDCERMDIYIPKTIEFVIELSLFVQDPHVVDMFGSALKEQIALSPTDFLKGARSWLQLKKEKHVKYIERLLRFYRKQSK